MNLFIEYTRIVYTFGCLWNNYILYSHYLTDDLFVQLRASSNIILLLACMLSHCKINQLNIQFISLKKKKYEKIKKKM